MSRREIIQRYSNEIVELDNQIVKLNELISEETSYIAEIKELIVPLDQKAAEITVAVNTKIEQYAGIATAAIGCGCSVSIGTTTFYETLKATRQNVEDTSYVGDEPFEETGDDELTSGFGDETVIVPAKLGLGVDTFVTNGVGIGASVVLRAVLLDFVSICSTSCGDYASQQTVLLNDINSLRAERTNLVSGSSSLKTELVEYYTRRYSYQVAIDELNGRKTNIGTFLGVLNNSDYTGLFPDA